MQLLTTLFNGNTMKGWSVILLVMSILFAVNVVLSPYAFAIGKWEKGVVTQRPWQENFIHIRINVGQDTKYTIMKDAKVNYVYEKNGAQYEKPMAVSSIHAGDTLLFMVEGNRIYQIKIIN